MNIFYFLLSGVAALVLGSCASPGFVCQGEPDPIELSPSHRTERGLQLVSISNTRKVTVRFEDGTLASARPGEEFKKRDGTPAPHFYKLRSADTSSGRVVVEGTMFVMYVR